jgi:hypothetical protein
LADALSKANFRAFWAARTPGSNVDPYRVPPSILAWVANPKADDELGTRVLRDLGLR